MYNNIIQAPSFYRVGNYIRLSESDEDKTYESDSESVINQRHLLMDFVKENGFTFVDEYVDDGYTGTNFNRPGFQRMIKDIESGRINCVITKDLSRLGRNHVGCGNLLEEYFPANKIRFISILDGVDTFLDSANNDIAPFKSLFNDMTSKDTSKKIRSILKNKKQQGKFIGSKPSFGYIRDPLDKGHLIPNPDTAWIVKRIFNEVSRGDKISDIIERLNNENIPTPSAYKQIKNSKRQINGYIWTCSTINKILKNRMYTGDMIQNVQTKLNYKSQKRICLSSEYWIIVENTHEPLVDKLVFNQIQTSANRTRTVKLNRPQRLLEGLLYCKECGNKLTVSYREKRNYWSINCNKYSRSPRQRLCEPHFSEYNSFEKIILNQIKKTCKKYIEKVDIDDLVSNVKSEKDNKEDLIIEKQKLESNIKDLQLKIAALYEDKYNGIISVDTYTRLSSNTENLIRTYNSRIKELENCINEVPKKHNDEETKQKIKELISMKKPTRELLFILVDKIIVDKDKNVEIIYNFNK